MRGAALPLLVLATISCASDPARVAPPPVPAPAGRPELAVRTLEAALRARIAAAAPAEVAVVLLDQGSGLRIGIGDTVTMHAASTMKVPVLLELYRQAAAGRFSLDDSVLVSNEFTSIADGSRYTLSVTDDSEGELYRRLGQPVTLRALARPMIVRSSNLATNILIEHVTADSVRRTLRLLGAEGMHVLRGVEDGPAFRQGLNNTTTAAAFARVLEAISRCAAGRTPPRDLAALAPLRAEHCQELVATLEGQEFREQIPAGLPPGTRAGSKTGWITGIHHDGAIVFPATGAPYVLVVLTRGIADRAVSARLAADISRQVWQALMEGIIPPDPLTAEAALLHQRHALAAIATRRFTHQRFWDALGPVVEVASSIERQEVGRSAEGRPIHLLRYGRGPTRVLLWSQMHGDEPTATMALADLFHFLAREPSHPLARRLAEQLTILAVPMLNPDGAERHQRRNAQGIDINRDARALVTSEARVLAALHEAHRPAYGFNLHDQNVRTRVGRSDRLAAIALLAPSPGAAHAGAENFRLAQLLAAAIRRGVEPIVAGHIARYDDTFNPRAFGDLMQQWGTSTVLIETGGWPADPEKQYLRRATFIAILTGLDAIATGSHLAADPAWYVALPPNGRAVNDLLLLGGEVVVPGLAAPYRADIAIDYDDALARTGGRIVDVGDLREAEARDTLDAAGLHIHVDPAEAAADGTTAAFGTGLPARLTLRRPDGRIVWIIQESAPRRR
jgi:beta-lactamase class A